MTDFVINEDNTNKILNELDGQIEKALETIGLKVEKYAKALCPVGTPESTGIKGYRGGTLRNSISHVVDKQNNQVNIGTNVEYAPYVELGTGPFFEPPPDWEKFTGQRGSGIGGGYVHARPFLRPAITDHKDEWKLIIENELKH